MKAISRLLIVFLLMVGTTGFGLTTADLNQNSEPDLVICDCADSISVDVVSITSDYQIKELAPMSVSSINNQKLFIQEDLKTNILSYVKDVGWQKKDLKFALKNYQSNIKKKTDSRNPRDGLSC